MNFGSDISGRCLKGHEKTWKSPDFSSSRTSPTPSVDEKSYGDGDGDGDGEESESTLRGHLRPPSSPRLSEGSPSGKKRARSEIQSAMSKLCFTETLDKLSIQNIQELNAAYRFYEGKLPSRKELRSLSERIRVSQSRIRRWFLDHLVVPPTPPEFGSPGILKPSSAHLVIDEMERRLIQMEERLRRQEERVAEMAGQLNAAKTQLDSLTYFSPFWL